MQQEEGEEGERGPEPADLDEEHVEQVAFAGEVRGRQRGGVGLQLRGVGGRAGAGVEQGEERAEEEGGGVDGEEERFVRGGEEGGARGVVVSGWRGREGAGRGWLRGAVAAGGRGGAHWGGLLLRLLEGRCGERLRRDRVH